MMTKHRSWQFPLVLVCLMLVMSGPVVGPLATVRAEASSVGMAASIVELEDTLESIYTQLCPAVVNIRMIQAQEERFPVLPEIPGLPFGQPPAQQPRKFFRQGSGSGFVWDTQGHIVTNNHMIADADRISVTFSDGTTIREGADAQSAVMMENASSKASTCLLAWWRSKSS